VEVGDADGASLAARVHAFGMRHALSQRESEILLLVARGVHPKSVAESVGCGYSSVRTHLRRTYKKLGCSGARELMIRFFSENLPR